MPSEYYRLNTDKSWQSMLLENDRLLLSTQPHRDADVFQEKWGKKSIFKREREILIGDIARMAHDEKAPRRLNLIVGSSKVFFDFKDTAAMEAVVAQLQSQKNFAVETTNVSSFRASTPALIGLGISLFFGFVVYMDARTLESGSEIHISGRRRWMQQLLASLAGALGTNGTLLVFGGLALLSVVWMVRALRTPPREVVYS